MLVFRVAPDLKEPKVGRDFVLVREMALADRDPNGPFLCLLSEEPAKAPAGKGPNEQAGASDDYLWDLSLIHISEPTRPY